MQTWLLSAKYLYYVEMNAVGLTREILTDLINLVTKNGKASHISNQKTQLNQMPGKDSYNEEPELSTKFRE